MLGYAIRFFKWVISIEGIVPVDTPPHSKNTGSELAKRRIRLTRQAVSFARSFRWRLIDQSEEIEVLNEVARLLALPVTITTHAQLEEAMRR